MGGFRRAMPFTFVTFTIGALALAGFPPFSGFLSKDEILAFTINRGGGFVLLAVIGYIAALLTAFYAFRMVFRVFFGEPAAEALELEEGHLAHHEPPVNPLTGEEEDNDVGFQGAVHHIAEREWPMKVAMGVLAFAAVVGGVLGIPSVSDTLNKFLEPSFADSRYASTTPSSGTEWGLLGIGGVISVIGIGLAYLLYMRRPGTTARLVERYSGVHRFLSNKWYFDELYDRTVVQPLAMTGRFFRGVVETDFVQATIVGGATTVVSAASAFVRNSESGYLRAYALGLLAGVAGLALYFLIAST
jgi:NADH-quinone oxidoreductase subunit L